MTKLSSSLKNMALSLTVVAVLAAFVLGLVHNLTAEPIAKAKNQAEAEAIYKVVGIVPENDPFADSTYVSIKGSRDKLQVFPIRQNGLIRAFAIKTNSRKGLAAILNLWSASPLTATSSVMKFLKVRKRRDWAQRFPKKSSSRSLTECGRREK